MGVLQAVNKTDDKPFTTEDEKLLEAFSSQVGGWVGALACALACAGVLWGVAYLGALQWMPPLFVIGAFLCVLLKMPSPPRLRWPSPTPACSRRRRGR